MLAAYYCREPLSERAERALRSAPEVCLSDLTGLELTAAVSRKVRARGLSPESARAILDLFTEHLEQGVYRRLAITAAHFLRAREQLSRLDTPLRTLDALHLAVAADSGATLLTADRTLHAVARAAGLGSRLLTERKSRFHPARHRP